MPKYEVEFQQDRKAFYSARVIVEAASEDEAKKLAQEKVDNLSWEHFDDETLETNIVDVYETYTNL